MVTSLLSDRGQILDFVQKHALLVIKQVSEPVVDREHCGGVHAARGVELDFAKAPFLRATAPRKAGKGRLGIITPQTAPFSTQG